jgi:hypothetical protein
VQLAAEADVKRWVLTHKHTDLADEFRSRVAASGPIPAAYSNLEQRAREAQNANQELRAQNSALRSPRTPESSMSCTPLWRTNQLQACRSFDRNPSELFQEHCA